MLRFLTSLVYSTGIFLAAIFVLILVLSWLVPGLNCFTLPFSIILFVVWRKNKGVKAVQKYIPNFMKEKSGYITPLKW